MIGRRARKVIMMLMMMIMIMMTTIMITNIMTISLMLNDRNGDDDVKKTMRIIMTMLTIISV